MTELDLMPRRGVMYGLTHDLAGNAVVRVAKVLKVSIGLPKNGRAIHTWLQGGKWHVRVGLKDPKIETFNNRKDAEVAYKALAKTAPPMEHPAKLSYFTFTRPTAEGTYEPDFAVIEAHGEMPTEIGIVFMDNEPFDSAYRAWGTSELKCWGDGKTASRVLSLAKTDEEKALAEAARKDGQIRFPILEGCAAFGCPWIKNNDPKAGLVCKPNGDLRFQLANNLQVGGTAFFSTVGYRSVMQVHSSLHQFRTFTGRGDPTRGRIVGIPFRMIVRPFKAKYDGGKKSSKAYGVHLDFWAETVQDLQQRLIVQASKLFDAIPEERQARQVRPQLMEPKQIADEYYPELAEEAEDDLPMEDEPGMDEEPEEPQPPSMESKTAEKAEALAERLAAEPVKPKQQAPPDTVETKEFF